MKVSLPTCRSCAHLRMACGKTGFYVWSSSGCSMHEPKPRVPISRMAVMCSMEPEEMAAYLEQELGDSTPVDWLAWLQEIG